MLGVAIGLIIVNITTTIAVGVTVTNSINKVNRNVNSNMEINCDINSKLKDLNLNGVENRLKSHLSKEMWDLSFRKVPNVVVIKKEGK